MRVAMIGPRTVLGKDSPQKLIPDLHANTADILRSRRDAAPPMDSDLVDQVFFDEFVTEPEGPSR